jgi:hypothetical protein
VNGSSYTTAQYTVSYSRVAPDNIQATTTATISGSPIVGSEVTLTGGYSDGNGILTSVPVISWYSGTTNVGSGLSYVLKSSDIGELVFPIIQFYDDAGYLETISPSNGLLVQSANTAPVATAVSVTTDEDTAKTGTLAGTDVEGSSLTFAKVADPTNGTVTINATTGAYTYTPNANYNGSDSFTFKVNDGTADSAVATVSITVDAVGYDVSVQTQSWRGVALPGVQFQDDPNNRTNSLGAVTLPDLEDKDGSFDGLVTLSPNLTAPSTAASAGVTLTDVLAALKIYLGKPLPDAYVSPYNYIAADFDGNGSVNLTDVLSLLKFYLGKTTTVAPAWVFVDAADVTGTGKAASILRAGSDSLPIDATNTQPHVIDQDFSIDTSIELVGVLRGDFVGSWTSGG